MTPSRQRMIDAMVLRGFAARTQESYADAIYAMAKHYRRDPAEYSDQEVEAYLLHLINERHLSWRAFGNGTPKRPALFYHLAGLDQLVAAQLTVLIGLL